MPFFPRSQSYRESVSPSSDSWIGLDNASKSSQVKFILLISTIHIDFFASDKLKADKQLVLEAVNHDELALCCASDELKADKEVVLEAVKHYGCSLV